MNARSNALAKQDKQIAESAERAAAAKPRKNALQQMGERLNIEPNRLITTLRSTVFEKANDEEFAALIIVANEYQLNPLLKEIYAFPSRGGIMPMVGYDGWVAIMNRHPQFDGYEHNDIMDGDKFLGVETVIHRKDRNHPTKITIYLDEFKMNTDPWKQKPRHMCRIRSLCQSVRVAFGITGLYVEGADDTEYAGDVEAMQPARIPTDKELRQQEAEAQGADQETGEIIDQQPVDEEQEREIQEQLDAQQSAQERGLSDDEPAEVEGEDITSTDEAEGEDITYTDEDAPAWQAAYDEISDKIDAVKTEADWRKADALYQRHAAALPDDESKRLDATLTRVLKRIRGDN